MRVNKYCHRFVSTVPDKLEKGVLYISLECNVIIFLCACGCKEKVVLPIAPEHWHLKYDGEGISITPSIGNTYFDCRSHYYITDNKVQWLEKMKKYNNHSIRKKKRKWFSFDLF